MKSVTTNKPEEEQSMFTGTVLSVYFITGTNIILMRC